MNEITLGMLLRLVQVLAMSAPTILIGVFVAGVFERLIGYDNILRVFGKPGLKSLFLAWLLGMLLPVCSLGVLPILRVMRRAGLSGGTLLAFALSAPLFNPLSLLYGLTLSRPYVIIAFASCSLILVTIIGQLWDYFFTGTERAEPPLAQIPPGWKRIVGMLLGGMRSLGSTVAVFIFIGLIGSALLAAVLPHGTLQGSINGDNIMAPLNILPVSVCCYSTPQQVMGQIGMMFTHANSVGAALVLLALGTGLNLGTIVWMGTEYGWWRGVAFLAALVILVLGLAYAVNSPLHPHHMEQTNHTHAFDVYTNPFAPQGQELLIDFLRQFKEVCTGRDQLIISLLLGILLASLLLGWFDPQKKIEHWLTQTSASATKTGGWDYTLSAPIVGVVFTVALVVMSVMGCYVFYPPPEEVIRDIAAVKAEAIYNANKLDSKEADVWIGMWEEYTRRMEVGALIRGYHVSGYQRMKGQIVRNKLELLKHKVEEGDQEAVKKLVRELHPAHTRLREALLPSPKPKTSSPPAHSADAGHKSNVANFD